MRIFLKNTLIILTSLSLVSSFETFASTTPLWWTILNNLRNEWRTDDEIRKEIEDLWYDANEYLWKRESNINNSSSQSKKLETTEAWRKIINNLRSKGRTDNEIRKEIEKLWYDASWYFWNNSTYKDNNLTIKISNKSPSTDERIKLIIDIDKKYTWKITFSKLQYYNQTSEKRINIDPSSDKYISDYCDDLDKGYIRLDSSDKWNISISNFIKFTKSGKYRIYAKDSDWNEDYVQISIKSDDKEDNNSENSKLTLSTSITNFSINEPIDLTIKSDDYVGILSLYAKYRDLTSDYRITLNNTSTEYIWNYSNTWEDWFYKMTSDDDGKKTLYNLVEFKKSGAYRIYAEDKDWYNNFVQIYINSSNNKNSNNINNINHNNSESYNDDEIEKLIKNLLNTWNNTTTQNNVERNKENIEDSEEEIYITRNCKQYKIQYNKSLWVFTSPNLKKAEYFINKEYLKRYIDSKNPQKENCPKNSWWIYSSYMDKSESSNNYIAPNWKVYFISQQNWYFTSNELNNKKDFNTISALIYFIRDRNPLIWMTTI